MKMHTVVESNSDNIGTSSPTNSATTFSEDCQHPNIPTVFSAYEVPSKAENTVAMLGCWHAFMILNSRKKSCTIFSSKLGFKIHFKATGISCTFRVPKKNHPCCTAGERTFAGKDFAPVLAVGRMILGCSLHGGFLQRSMGGFFPRSMGKTCVFLALCFGCWAPTSSNRRFILYVAGPGPLAPWMWCLSAQHQNARVPATRKTMWKIRNRFSKNHVCKEVSVDVDHGYLL